MVLVRIREHRLLGGAAVFRAEIEINRHVLLGPGRRVVEREIIDVMMGLVARACPTPRRRFRKADKAAPASAIRAPTANEVSLSLR